MDSGDDTPPPYKESSPLDEYIEKMKGMMPEKKTEKQLAAMRLLIRAENANNIAAQLFIRGSSKEEAMKKAFEFVDYSHEILEVERLQKEAGQ